MIDLSNRLKNKVVLVTGAAAGIGRASSLRMVAEGAKVIAVDIDEDGLSTLAKTPGIETHKLDITRYAAIEDLAATVRKVDVLFNCVGIVPSGTILDCTLEDWSRAFNINVSSCFAMTKVFLPGM